MDDRDTIIRAAARVLWDCQEAIRAIEARIEKEKAGAVIGSARELFAELQVARATEADAHIALNKAMYGPRIVTARKGETDDDRR